MTCLPTTLPRPHGLVGLGCRLARRTLAGAVLVSMAACSVLPRIHPDMANDARGPRVEGARGPLSPERSRQILEELRAKGGDPSVLDRHLALETAVVDSPLVAGNRVRLLQNGPATYDAMFEAIAAARDHINMESYIFEPDETGARFAAALLEKQRQGVQVNLIYDSIGTLHATKEFFEPLIAAGVGVVEFNPINPLKAKAGWDLNERDHRKLLVVDGRTAFMGGINISGVYASGGSGSGSSGSRAAAKSAESLPWRDTDLRIDGPVVAELQKLFFETWQKQKGPTPPERDYYPMLTRQGDEVVHAIGGAPEMPFNPIYATLISAINASEKEAWLTAAYFVPDPQLREALKAAVARGVDVRIVLPSTTDSALVLNAGRYYYDELLEAGIKLYERQNMLLHAKTVLIDGVWATIGSTNLDWRSFLHNQELSAVVLGTGFGEQMRAAFLADVAASEPVLLEERRRRPVDQRVKEAFGRLWQYWL